MAAGAGCVSDFSGFVGEAEPVLVFIMPMLEKFMLGRPLPTNVEIVVKIPLQQNTIPHLPGIIGIPMPPML